MDIKRILKLHIPDIHPTYGGVRGKTMSSRGQLYAWPIIREAGVNTIIDLRNDCMSRRMRRLCEEHGMEYFYYPVDNRADVIENMVEMFPKFCKHIDRGCFYIACAMGLHRTDIALCTYWVFYGSDKGLEPPTLQGYLKETGHNTSKILRVLNAFYDSLCEKQGEESMSIVEFKRRKQIINKQARNIMNKRYKVCFVCTGNACRSPFAECVTKVLLSQKGAEGIEVFSLGTLDWGKNPRDATMIEVAQQMGYELTGFTTHMTRESLMSADCIIVFDEHHRNAITRELDYEHWDRIVQFNKIAFGTDEAVDDPHYQSLAIYQRVAQHIEEGCKRIVNHFPSE